MTHLFKALLAKAWKDQEANLSPGTHFIDEEFVVRLSGYVEKQADQQITPTASVPLISVLAFFWEKSRNCSGRGNQVAAGSNHRSNARKRL